MKPVSREMKSVSREMKPVSREMKPVSREMKSVSREMKAISREIETISYEMVSLADIPDLFDKEVELFIVPKTSHSLQIIKNRTNKARAFVDKWTGVLLTDKKPDDLKYDYLMEKYR
jgi:hypothetical protein